MGFHTTIRGPLHIASNADMWVAEVRQPQVQIR
jgi:hypothetical protein